MTNAWKMIGNDWAADLLQQHAARGEVRHAYLLCGPSGVGRRPLALRLAQALNCTTPIAAGVPCGTCRDCTQIEALRHPDVGVVEPTIVDSDDRKELIPDPSGEIRIRQIREFQRTLLLKPFQGKFRVVLFLRFQTAADSAANALLKTLEEAPPHAVLILTADAPEQLLPTIVSRCEVLRLRPIPAPVIEADLIARGVEAQRAHLLAHISGGRPGYARRLIDDDSLLEQREQRLNDLQDLLPATRVEKFSYAEKLAKDKDSMRQTISFWLSYWRDVLLRAAGAEIPLVNVDRNVEIEFLAERFDLPRVRRVVDDLEGALEKMERNVNPRLLAEVLLLDWPKS